MTGINKKWFLPEIFGFGKIPNVIKKRIKAPESRIAINLSNWLGLFIPK